MATLEQQCLYNPDPARFVYHYTSADTAITHILPSRKLRLSPYTKTNDPKESKGWQFFTGTNENRSLDPYPVQKISEEMTFAFKANTKLFCSSIDGDLQGSHLDHINERGFTHPRMWAQYGSNHRGVCFVLDKGDVSNAVRAVGGHEAILFCGAVKYCNRPVLPNFADSPYGINVDVLERIGQEAYIKQHLRYHVKRLFFEKARDWRDECELRWVLFNSLKEYVYFDASAAIKGIVFGADCADGDIAKIVELSDERPTWFEQLVWKGCSPWYSFNHRWPRY